MGLAVEIIAELAYATCHDASEVSVLGESIGGRPLHSTNADERFGRGQEVFCRLLLVYDRHQVLALRLRAERLFTRVIKEATARREGFQTATVILLLIICLILRLVIICQASEQAPKVLPFFLLD